MTNQPLLFDDAAILWVRAQIRAGSPRRTIVVTTIEYRSGLEPAVALERESLRCVAAPVGIDGTVNLRALAGLIGDDTPLFCVMAANNETVVLQPLEAVVALAQAAGGLRLGAQCGGGGGGGGGASGLVIP